MLRSVLIGLDGSAHSRAAIELALRWARRQSMLLAGIGIIDEPAIRSGEAVPLGGTAYKKLTEASRLEAARQRVKELLDGFSEQCARADVSFRAIEDVGRPHEQIILEAERYDLVMLGQRTYFHFETREGAGDTLQRVLKCTPRPVVTVPEKLRDGSTVVVAYDGSVQAARTLQAFQAMELCANEEVHVVSVHAEPLEASRCANRAVEFLGLHDVTAHTVPVVSSKPAADAILEQANRLNASLLVMGAFGQPSIREALLGSVTRSILKDSIVPLFLFH
jgi:nucleotide-binding universal stress UspA family protein